MSTIFFKILKGGKILQERYETFTVLINRISRNIKKIKNKEMAEYDLRSPHISCLYYIYLEKNITATMLCEKCEEDKATISRALDYLEEKGVTIYSNYDYETHSCSSPEKYCLWTETWHPAVLAKMAHGYLGKPKRILLFNQISK